MHSQEGGLPPPGSLRVLPATHPLRHPLRPPTAEPQLNSPSPGTHALTGAPRGSREGVSSVWTWADRMGRWLGEGFKGLPRR